MLEDWTEWRKTIVALVAAGSAASGAMVNEHMPEGFNRQGNMSLETCVKRLDIVRSRCLKLVSHCPGIEKYLSEIIELDVRD